ncbi:ABC transporter family protein [Brucella suis]|nr:D-xylose transport ATP-binding protein XylG [Brucella suis bv. 2]ENR20895.1 xylose import ATP-binding protein XylG [Brucella suis 92/63]ENR24514.1 xylose import ATP-binding protein XylG [Brucella suis 94/11]ENR30526.1 xylose import ATP-binding protein XylG [Brucella suis F4/06-146]ENR32546.1 xylose import ATP-binding protein XylG [Brucella suis F5/03-2]ENR39495.1 xylose import ATP-binding protein XylG [Brucella suis F8/06-2]ENT32678.1 xylose import ATP-binding protein XylG [Brucella suis 6
MSEYLLEMRNIGKEFNGVKALDGIYLKVRAGECVGLCGENGAGKSTLMKVRRVFIPMAHGLVKFSGKAKNLKPVAFAIPKLRVLSSSIRN